MASIFDISSSLSPRLTSGSLAIGVLIALLLVLRSRTATGSTLRYGKRSTAKQVIDGFSNGNSKYLAGKTYICTGGNSGIGLETCKALASAGANVIMTSRSTKSAEDAIRNEVVKPGLGGYTVDPDEAKRLITVKQLDLASLKSVESFCQDILATVKRVDGLICNAGIMMTPTLEKTADGFESQIGVNHFGHAYLYYLLKDLLKSQDVNTRVVLLSSLAHQYENLQFEDLNFQNGRKYDPMKAYGQSKLANILFAKAVAQETRYEYCLPSPPPPPFIFFFVAHPTCLTFNAHTFKRKQSHGRVCPSWRNHSN